MKKKASEKQHILPSLCICTFFFLITAINSESEIWCKILCNLDTEKTTTQQIWIAFDQRSLSREELSMLIGLPPSCPPPLPPKFWPTPAALGLSSVSRRLPCGSHYPSICDAQRSFWSFEKALQQNIQSYFFKSHILCKLISNSKWSGGFSQIIISYQM